MAVMSGSPESFTWFSRQWQLWLQQMRLDQVPNALLLAGVPGIGKSSLAKRLAHLLLCEQMTTTVEPRLTANDACGVCKNCQLALAESHPDFIWIEPEEGSRSVKIDQVRQLTEFVQTKPQISQRKVAVLQPAEAMNNYAANAILKTLEEPQGDTVVILITRQLSLLLPTIRSRCQIIKLATPGVEEANQWLAKQIDLPPEKISELLSDAGGQPVTALDWNNSGQAGRQIQLLEHWSAYLAGELDAFSVAEKWAKLNTDWVLVWLGNMLRDSLRSKRDSSYLLSQALASVAARLSEEAIWCLYQELLEISRSHQQQRNLNMQLVFEHWLLQNKRKY